MENEKLKKTALYDIHVKHGGKMIGFAGYLMPVQYKGIISEHMSVRNKVGVFDVSHMGEIEFTGNNALEMLQLITINDVSKIKEYQAQYSAMCYDSGGIIDDIIIYRFPDKYLMVVNAANRDKDFKWIIGHRTSSVEISDISDNVTLLAVQGPESIHTLQKLTDYNLESIEYFHFAETKIAGKDMIVSRTGYTGESGFELFMEAEYSEYVWNEIFDAGKEYDIEPIGLGARDTLRLEKRYNLYGNDITQDTNPLEAGLGWITKLDKGKFCGRDALLKVKEEGIKRKLVGFVIEGKTLPRKGYEIFKDNKKLGFTTSGTMSPVLEKGIGMAYVLTEFSNPGTTFDVIVRDKRIKAEVVKGAFV